MAEERMIFVSENVPEWQRWIVQEIQAIQAIQEKLRAALTVTLDEEGNAHVLGLSGCFPVDAVVAAGHLMDAAQKQAHFPGGLQGLLEMMLKDPKRAAKIIMGEAGHGDE